MAIIIWNWNVGTYLHQRTLFSTIWARKIELERFNFSSWVMWILGKERTTLNDILDKLRNWEKVIYASKSWPLIDRIVDEMMKDWGIDKWNFTIFWTNWGLSYWWHSIPRVVLHAWIKEEQLNWNPPNTFWESIYYHPNPWDFEEDFVSKLDFPMKLTDDKVLYLKAFYLKLCINSIFNSISTLYESPITYWIEIINDHFPNSLEIMIEELYKIINIISPNTLSIQEISDWIYSTITKIPNVFPSSVSQFWVNRNGRMLADYKNSDIWITLAFLLKTAKTNWIETPMLLNLHKEIVGKWNRRNWVHHNNPRYFWDFDTWIF